MTTTPLRASNWITDTSPRMSGAFSYHTGEDDPTNQSLGWWDAERKVFTTMHGDEHLGAYIQQWRFTGYEGRFCKWQNDRGSYWAGPKLWQGPIVADWTTHAGRDAGQEG